PCSSGPVARGPCGTSSASPGNRPPAGSSWSPPWPSSEKRPPRRVFRDPWSIRLRPEAPLEHGRPGEDFRESVDEDGRERRARHLHRGFGAALAQERIAAPEQLIPEVEAGGLAAARAAQQRPDADIVGIDRENDVPVARHDPTPYVEPPAELE